MDGGDEVTGNDYKYSLAITSQFYFCGIPFRLDTCPKCSFNCKYCFAMARGGRRSSQNLIANPDKIRKKIERSLFNSHKNRDIIGEMIHHRLPIHFGGMSDPFSNKNVTQISMEILKIMKEYDYPVVISTQNSTKLIEDKTLRLLKELKHIAIQITLVSLNEAFSKKITPAVPAPMEKIKSISLLSKEGFHVIVRLQPLFPFLIKEICEELIPRLSEAGVKHVIVEFLKLPVEKNTSLIKEMFKILKWDGYEYYKKQGAILVGREWVLPAELKWIKLQPIIESIHKHGMTYGAGDYGLNHLSDTDCCCGIDVLEGFNKWFKCNFSNIIKNSKSNYIKFSEVTEQWIPKGSIAMYINSNCRLKNKNTVLNHLKEKWNRPGTVNAPDSFLGIHWEGGYDEEGNCVYVKKNISF